MVRCDDGVPEVFITSRWQLQQRVIHRCWWSMWPTCCSSWSGSKCFHRVRTFARCFTSPHDIFVDSASSMTVFSVDQLLGSPACSNSAPVLKQLFQFQSECPESISIYELGSVPEQVAACWVAAYRPSFDMTSLHPLFIIWRRYRSRSFEIYLLFSLLLSKRSRYFYFSPPPQKNKLFNTSL